MACATASTVRLCASSPMKKWRPRATDTSCICLRNDFRCIHIKRKNRTAILQKNSRRGCRKTSFSEQPLARNHAFERISKKNRVLRTHFFFPCINSEIHAPGIYEFAKQIRLNACCRTKHKNRILLFRQAGTAILQKNSRLFLGRQRMGRGSTHLRNPFAMSIRLM